MGREVSDDVVSRLLDYVDRTQDLVGVCDEHGVVLYLNQAARKHLGVGDADELTTADFFAPEAFASYYDEVRPTLLRSGVWSGELPIRTRDGASIPMQFAVVAGVAPGGEITGLVTYGRPQSYRPPDSGPALAFAHDAAELVDRAVVTEWLGTALDPVGGSGDHVALAYAELRGVRGLLARYGDFVTDGVIRAAARRMTTTVRRSDLVARVGRNAFFIAFTDVRDVAEALRLGQTLKETLEREAIWTAAGQVTVTLDVGLTLADRGDDAVDAMRRAEAAEIGKGAASAPTFGVAAVADTSVIAMHEALRLAAMKGEVRTLVRPIVDRAGRVVSYDAFARWSNSPTGTIEAQRLSELADRVGVGTAISLRVLRECAAFVMTTPSDDALGVVAPLSDELGRDPLVEQYLWEIADALSLPLSQVALLVDQRVVARRGVSGATLRSLREAGARVVVANVDEQHELASIAAEYGLDGMRFADDVVRRCAGDRSLLGALERRVAEARRLGLRVSAGGVATPGDHEVVLQLGLDEATGDYYGAAVAAEPMD